MNPKKFLMCLLLALPLIFIIITLISKRYNGFRVGGPRLEDELVDMAEEDFEEEFDACEGYVIDDCLEEAEVCSWNYDRDECYEMDEEEVELQDEEARLTVDICSDLEGRPEECETNHLRGGERCYWSDDAGSIDKPQCTNYEQNAYYLCNPCSSCNADEDLCNEAVGNCVYQNETCFEEPDQDDVFSDDEDDM